MGGGEGAKKRGREGGERKSGAARQKGSGLEPGTYPRARRESPAVRHGGCLDKQAFPCL